MARKPIMAGNWKMNLDHIQAIEMVNKLAMELSDRRFNKDSVEVVLVTPFTDIRSVQTVIDADKLPLKYGAQDVSEHESGAYTGEVSAAMLEKLGCSYVVVGHSERREYHGETDAVVGAKARAAVTHGIVPIICCGEALEIRQAGTHVDHVITQIRGALEGFSGDEVKDLVIAYEPIWAIGTGEVATPADAEEVCGAIRELIADLYDREVADAIRILYGGSVNSRNVKELMAESNVDGGLVGGASLKADEFAKIADYRNL